MRGVLVGLNILEKINWEELARSDEPPEQEVETGFYFGGLDVLPQGDQN